VPKQETTVVVGVPAFQFHSTESASEALGVEEVEVGRHYEGGRVVAASPKETSWGIVQEYLGVMAGLGRMGIPFKGICSAAHGQAVLRDMLKDLPFEVIEMPEMGDPRAVTFPRDLCTVLPNGLILIDRDLATWLRLMRGGIGGGIGPVAVSPFAIGGRIVFSNKLALVHEHLLDDQTADWELVEQRGYLEVLKLAGLKVAVLPNSVRFETRRNPPGLGVDDHMDRSTSEIITDRQGGRHIIVNPALRILRMGQTALDSDAILGTKESISVYRRLLKPYDVEVHVPAKMTVPLGFNCWKDDGNLLISSGDVEIRQIAERILGRKRVFTTAYPFKVYPELMSSGVRCVINRLPNWLLNLGTVLNPRA